MNACIRPMVAGALVAVLLSCAGGGDGPSPTTPSPTPTPTGATTYDLKLGGITSKAGAVVLDLGGVPIGTQITAGAGLVLHQRAGSAGSNVTLFLAGDLTGSAILHIVLPKAGTPTASVSQLSDVDGMLLDTSTLSPQLTAK